MINFKYYLMAGIALNFYQANMGISIPVTVDSDATDINFLKEYKAGREEKVAACSYDDTTKELTCVTANDDQFCTFKEVQFLPLDKSLKAPFGYVGKMKSPTKPKVYVNTAAGKWACLKW